MNIITDKHKAFDKATKINCLILANTEGDLIDKIDKSLIKKVGNGKVVIEYPDVTLDTEGKKRFVTLLAKFAKYDLTILTKDLELQLFLIDAFNDDNFHFYIVNAFNEPPYEDKSIIEDVDNLIEQYNQIKDIIHGDY